MPNDAPEVHRLNEQHLLITAAKDGKLHNAPLPDPMKSDVRILDVGCGSGIWCVQMAQLYPAAHVTGIDVSPIQPAEDRKPKNVEWAVHDMEQPWPFEENSFDLIHLSLVHGCVTDWNVMMKRIAR